MGNSDHSKGVFYSVLAGLMWGVLAIALKVAVDSLSAFTIVWVRFSIAFLLMAAYLLYRNPSAFLVFRNPPRKLVLASICLAINYLGFMKGLEYTTPGNAQVFIQLGPVLFAAVGIYIFKEKINWKHLIGFGMVLTGLALFYREQLLAMANQTSYIAGILWIVFAAISWAVYAILQKDLAGQFSTNQLNLFIYGFCTLLLVPFTKFTEFSGLNINMWALIIFLGVNTLVAYGAIALAFRWLDSSKVSVIIVTNPILTFILMYIFGALHVSWITPEHFSLFSIIGASMALGGAIVVIVFAGKRLK